MAKIRILATADIHFERMDKDKLEEYKLYFLRSLTKYKPNMFTLAGDTPDSRNLKAESKEYRLLNEFICTISKKCDELGIMFTVLQGTPSHEGHIMQNIITINNLNITYYGEITKMYFKGFSVLFLPELYCTNLDQFNQMVKDELGNDKVDICIFHGMFDFAIPALKQIDSAFNQSRSIVIDSKDFQDRYIKSICFGGHVHKAFNSGKVYYLGRFVNEKTQEKTSDMFGIKCIDVYDTGAFDITNITNPYLNDYKFITLEIDKDTTVEDLTNIIHLSECKKNTTVFKVIVDNNSEAKSTFGLWRKVYKPQHLKRKLVSERINGVLPDYVSSISTTILETKDIDVMVLKLYEEITNNTLDKKTLGILKRGERDDH